jgi:hypothetical protein
MHYCLIRQPTPHWPTEYRFYHNYNYIPKKGVTIGSPISRIMNEVFLQNAEKDNETCWDKEDNIL